MKTHTKALWWVITGAASIGLTSSLLQTIERIQALEHPANKLACDLSAVFSCTNVFGAWQSHVFGFSNSLICMMFFALTAGVGLAAATGSQLNAAVRHIFHFFAVFFLGFGAWYLWQSTYRIGFICIFCLVCYSAVILMNWAWFRLQYREWRLRPLAALRLETFVRRGGDVFAAVLWALAVAAMIVFHFW